MNLEAISWGMVGSVFAIVGLIYWIIRNLKSDVKNHFEAVFLKLNRIELGIAQIKESLAFLEAYNSFTMAMQNSEPTEENTRSKAAKEMWKRRKAKKLEKKD